MKLQIPNADYLYNITRALNGEVEGYDSLEDYEDDLVTFECNRFSLLGNPAPLPTPLLNVRMAFGANNIREYWSAIYLTAARKSAFSGMSQKFGRRFGNKDKTDLKWFSCREDGIGYFLEGDNSYPLISISGLVTGEGHSRVISLGDRGAENRKIQSLDRFYEEMGALQNVARVYINSCVNSGRRSVMNDLTLTLDCLP